MIIKKIGHCCLLIKTKGLTILTDPGSFSTDQNLLTGVDIVLITHEHADHFHTESVKEVFKNNPQVTILTNSSVGEKLSELSIPYKVVEGRAMEKIGEIEIEAFDRQHEELFEEFGQVQNTGYFIDNKLFYPGDSFCNPLKPVDILALPVAGPWCKIPDAVRYALEVKPRVAFPVHDGMLQIDKIGGSHMVPLNALPKNGIEFVVMKDGDEKDF